MQAKELGQSLWLDYIDRRLLQTDQLRTLIERDGISGLTSNPSIFEKAIAGSDDYDAAIREIVGREPDLDNAGVFTQLAIRDIQAAADQFLEVHEKSGGVDGHVSIEVSPKLAHDAQATIDAARKLHNLADRPNVMIKVPGTLAGVQAFEQLTADGISVNVTLLFSVTRYLKIAQAYISGLQQRADRGESVSGIASVASFFISRVDTEVDNALAALNSEAALALMGKVAIANARVAYGHYANLFGSEAFGALASLGANPQRLLWASTGTKNPDYSDVLYVEELIGPDTVNTLPPKTLEAFRDHGVAEQRLTRGLREAADAVQQPAALGIDLGTITDQLETAGIAAFDDAFERLLKAIGDKRNQLGT